MQTSSSSPASRLWLTLFGIAYVVLFTLFVVAVFTPAPYGDLTRIGRVPESDFGWRRPSAAIDTRYLQDVPLAEADVLVIGDSFSVERAWQSVLTAEGVKVASTHWDQLGGALCEDFGPWLRRQGFRGSTVIVQTIQRRTVLRINASRECSAMPRPFQPMGPAARPIDNPPKWTFNIETKLSTGLVTWLHGRRVRRALQEVVFRDPDNSIPLVSVRPIENGCQQFSHRLCDRGLFLAEDVVMSVPGKAEIAFARDFSDRVAQVPNAPKIVWMVVPDKTTVYADPGRGANFGAALEANALGPDLFSNAQSMRRHVVDLYRPNDTHLSTRGMLNVGETVRHWTIERRLVK